MCEKDLHVCNGHTLKQCDLLLACVGGSTLATRTILEVFVEVFDSNW